MALHRDIYWVGKQWAVTGHGVQACNQKQKAAFDIESSRLWHDEAIESVRGEKWVNTEDFDKAIGIARERFSEPNGKIAVDERNLSPVDVPSPRRSPAAVEISAEAPRLAQSFELHIERCPARFVRPWHIRVRR